MQYLVPELVIVIMMFVLIVLDLLLPKSVHRSIIGWLTVAALITAAGFVVRDLGWGASEPITFIRNTYRIDDFANLFKIIFLSSAALIVFMSLGSVSDEEIPQQAEMYYLFLPATLGAMVVASSGDLITLFIGLELMSVTTYILVGIRKSRMQSTEGAFKYVVLSGISSAFLLYGMSFLYGMTGTTDLALLRQGLMAGFEQFDLLIYISFFLMLVGIAFKIAAAPFHTWAADVYQGAPIPVAAFLAVVSKGAGIALLYRLIYNVFYGVGSEAVLFHDDVFLALSVLAAAAMIFGNTLALRQRNTKRLLAFSGIANSGYLLVPISLPFTIVHFDVFSEGMYYLIAYALMNIGAFAVITAVNKASGHEELSGFAGLYYRAPSTALAMVALVLSLAGLPLTGGFMGKLYILLGTMSTHQYWLGAVMILTSVISYYYYFGIIRQMFMRSGPEAVLIMAMPLRLTIWFCAAGSVILGFFPGRIIDGIRQLFSISSDLLFKIST
ncbi:NADH:ubiquinone oxidoreductase subunit N [Paenibacillus swuensis]|uniref:NADH-quinone oxidoreductase subunit N n=2 Tax=Paenibacillus swuensis TaxID=1178515 RepID=A0A172TP91_9BACL|nr:NADH-quinone oxidoreductase subunit N [Paenibacillus swuensis]ANE48858.1 NADH:ubiquinone oxidoreductase subunit N [Paenibacillus swuensis]